MGRVKIVSASAGSGKTYNLALEYVGNVIADPGLYRHIAAVTFTNKATEEMKRRILLQLNDLTEGHDRRLSEQLTELTGFDENAIKKRAETARNHILHDYNNFSVLTIDKFFQRIIRSFVKELSIDINFNLELQTDTLLGSAADKLIDDISNDNELREWVMEFIDEKVDLSDKWNIKEGLVALGNELFKEDYRRLASKADVPKKRLRDIVIKRKRLASESAERCKQSAEEFLQILSLHSIDESDLYQGARGVAGYVHKVVSGVFPEPNSYVMAALEEGKWAKQKSATGPAIEAAAPQLSLMLEQIIDRVRESVVLRNNAELIAKHYRNFALITDLRHRADDICRTESIVPISEINNIISGLIADNDSPFIFEKVGNYFSHFMIDEFQDTSAIQWQNFLPLLKNATSQSEASPVLLVGDVKQSIYRWRGGDWGILGHDVYNQFPEHESVTLTRNYRSRRTVVEFNNNMIGKCVETIGTASDNELDKAFANSWLSQKVKDELTGIIAKAYSDLQQTPSDSSDAGYVTVTIPDGDDEEVNPAIAIIEDLQRRGYRPKDIAILVRTNSQVREMATSMLDYKHTHPDSPYSFDVVTQEALTIGSSDLCAFVIACMQLAVNPDDAITLALFNRLQDRPFEQPLSDSEKEFLSSIELKSPEEAFEETVMRYRLGERRDEISYLQALHEQVMDFCSSKIADLSLFLEWWNDTGSRQSIAMPRETSAITIATIHKAKGLGFKAVVVPYCDWSLKTKANSILWSKVNDNDKDEYFPIGYVNNMAESAFSDDYYRETVMSNIDSLNTLYVAFTRAKEELHIIVPTRSRGIGLTLIKNITIQGEEARTGELCGTVSDTPSGRSIAFGHPTRNIAGSEEAKASATDFNTYPLNERVAVKYAMARYVEDNEESRLYPRQHGIMMHKILENATSSEDISAILANALRSGEISEKDGKALEMNINESFSNKTISDWFSGSWKVVRNENSILTPEGKRYRPDRVMIDGERAVVVDYKFGLHERTTYHRQVEEYMHLMRRMGHTDTRGYVWYIGLNRLVEVNCERA